MFQLISAMLKIGISKPTSRYDKIEIWQPFQRKKKRMNDYQFQNLVGKIAFPYGDDVSIEHLDMILAKNWDGILN